MSNFHEIRAQMRAAPAPNPGSQGMGLSALGLLAIAAAGAGIFYFLFMPVVVPLKPSASIPTFRQVNPDGSPQSAPDTRMPPAPPNPSQYAGLSYRQTGKLADEVCFARALALIPHWSKTPRLTTKELHDFTFDEMPHFSELMNCLLTEAPKRYCSSGQRSMIAGELSMYFRGIAYGNNVREETKAAITAARQSGRIGFDFGDPDVINQINRRELTPDPRVVRAIETRLSDGTMTPANRDAFIAAAPQQIRQRLAGIKPATQFCPTEPWWAFWRGF